MTTVAFSSGRKMLGSYLYPPGKFGDGSGNKRKPSRPDARCAHNWTSPVIFRSEPPTPVTRFAITCETSTAPSKNRKSFSRETGAPQQDILGPGFLMMHPEIKPTARVT